MDSAHSSLPTQHRPPSHRRRRATPGLADCHRYPVGIVGLALEHAFRTLFAKLLAAASFLSVNGGILYTAEHLRRGDLPVRDRVPHPLLQNSALTPFAIYRGLAGTGSQAGTANDGPGGHADANGANVDHQFNGNE